MAACWTLLPTFEIIIAYSATIMEGKNTTKISPTITP